MKSFRNFDEDLRNWFSKSHPDGGWKGVNTKGEVVGDCARDDKDGDDSDTSSEDPLYIRTHHREPVRVHHTIHVNGKLPANRPKGARPRSMTRDSALKNSRKILLAFAADECT